MAASIDASVGGTSSNSYCTLGEAETYHDTRLDNTAWSGATGDHKIRALITFTQLLDEWIRWDGSTNTSTQALQWPRIDVLDRHGVEYSALVIPQFVKDAESEGALWLLVSDRMADADTRGFSRLGAGPVQVTVDKFDRAHPIPDSVASKVRFAGTLRQVRPNISRLVRV